MSRKTKIEVAVDPTVVDRLNELSKRSRIPRNVLVRQALAAWLSEQEQHP